MILSGHTLYGTASGGGNKKDGTVFAVNTDGIGFTNLHTFIGSDGWAPDAGLILSGNTLYVILAWPTNRTGFTLQFATNLVSPTVWRTNSPTPVVVSGQNSVTNAISGAQKFYRLIQ